MLRAISFILIFNLFAMTNAEFFSATTEIEYLLDTEQIVIENIEFYIDNEEERLSTLRRILDIFKKEHEIALRDVSTYLGNPINAFILIKRLTSDLEFIRTNIEMGNEYINNVTMLLSCSGVRLPSWDDLSGATQALVRLQDMYNLDLTELSDGKMHGVTYSAPLSVSDCYVLGSSLFNVSDFLNSIAWMKEAYRKYGEQHDILYPHDGIQILEHIGVTYYILGDLENAAFWTKKVLDIEKDHFRAKSNVMYFESIAAQEEAKHRRHEIDKLMEYQGQTEKEMIFKNQISCNYKRLCRGELDVSLKISYRLTCRFLTENHPFLKIAPFKTEMLYLNPDVVLFHEAMSDSEIDFIMQMARPRLERATVYKSENGGQESEHRVSKSAWLNDEDSDIIARISRRVSDMTGLDTSFAEPLQVVNYGIGGQYAPHYDFTDQCPHIGNRIATVLFYMSNVTQGGATVFPEIGIRVSPVKGTAAMWFNLHASGEEDFTMLHASCPVLQGSKWVCSKWLHQYGQELIKPCDTVHQVGYSHNFSNAIPLSYVTYK